MGAVTAQDHQHVGERGVGVSEYLFPFRLILLNKCFDFFQHTLSHWEITQTGNTETSLWLKGSQLFRELIRDIGIEVQET